MADFRAITERYFMCASPFEDTGGFCLAAVTRASNEEEARDHLNEILREHSLRLEPHDEIHEIYDGLLLMSDELKEKLQDRAAVARVQQTPARKTVLQMVKENHPEAFSGYISHLAAQTRPQPAAPPPSYSAPPEVIDIITNYYDYPHNITPTQLSYIYEGLPPSIADNPDYDIRPDFGNLIILPVSGETFRVIGHHNLQRAATTQMLKESIGLYLKQNSKTPAYVVMQKNDTGELFYTQF
jgi:hypothetical protein